VVDGGRKRSPTLGRLRHVLTGLDGAVDGPRVAANDGGEGVALLQKGQTRRVHALQTNTFRKSGKGQSNDFRKVAEMQVFTETVGMPFPKQRASKKSNVWPQRPRFIELVKAKERSGVPFEEIAEHLDMKPSTLQGYIEQWTRPPSKKAISLASGYFKVHISEIWGPEMTPDQVEIMNAYSMVREALGYEKAESMGELGVLLYYRAAKAMVSAGVATTSREEIERHRAELGKPIDEGRGSLPGAQGRGDEASHPSRPRGNTPAPGDVGEGEAQDHAAPG
jgi:hypothetical protein